MKSRIRGRMVESNRREISGCMYTFISPHVQGARRLAGNLRLPSLRGGVMKMKVIQSLSRGCKLTEEQLHPNSPAVLGLKATQREAPVCPFKTAIG